MMPNTSERRSSEQKSSEDSMSIGEETSGEDVHRHYPPNVVGIDLGTFSSCIGVFRDGKVEIIPNDRGHRTTPSYVAFTDVGRLVGDAAKGQATMNPENTIFDALRLIGRKFDDPLVHSDMKYWPFKVVPDDAGRPRIQVRYRGEVKTFAPEQIIAMVLTKMKGSAEAFLGSMVKDAVVTVPSRFNNSQRKAIKDAGAIAGLNVLRTVDHPVAAALAFGLHVHGEELNVLVVYMGAGTLDVAVLTIDNGIYEVKSVASDTHLGGDDIDDRLVDHFVAEFNRMHNKNLRKNPHSLRVLEIACERAKRTLSTFFEATIQIQSLYEGIDFHASISRDGFEELCADLFRKPLEIVAKSLWDAKMDKFSIHDIVLVGGSTRIPKVQEHLSKYFEGKKLNESINPDEAVACGAAIEAAILSGDKSDAVKNILLLDVAPLSVGIELEGGTMAAVIGKNSTIPITNHHTFTTCAKDQNAVLIKVFEGERILTKDNYLLGEFELSGLSQQSNEEFEGERALTKDNNLLGEFELSKLSQQSDEGQLALRILSSSVNEDGTLKEDLVTDVTKIEITFDMNSNGDLIVSAREVSTGRQNDIIITNDKGHLSKDEIVRMFKEEEKFKFEDTAHRHGK